MKNIIVNKKVYNFENASEMPYDILLIELK